MTQKDLTKTFEKQSKESESYLRAEFYAYEIEHFQHPQNWLWLYYGVHSEVKSYYVAFARDFLDQPPSIINSALRSMNLSDVIRESKDGEIVLIRPSGIEKRKKRTTLPPC